MEIMKVKRRMLRLRDALNVLHRYHITFRMEGVDYSLLRLALRTELRYVEKEFHRLSGSYGIQTVNKKS